MGPREILDSLLEALALHGISARRGAKDVSLNGHDLRFEAAVIDHPATNNHQMLVLQIHAYSPVLDVNPIVESFAGVGATRADALKQAFEKFLRGVFHLLLEGLADHVCGDARTEVELWTGKSGIWKVYVGPAILFGRPAVHSDGTQSTLLAVYQSFYRDLQKLFATNVSNGSHFIRAFVACSSGNLTVAEAVLDNEPWPEAERLLRQQTWQCSDNYQTLRHVLLAVPHRKLQQVDGS